MNHNESQQNVLPRTKPFSTTGWLALIVTVALFLWATQLAHQYKDVLLGFDIAQGTQGMMLYAAVVVVSIVVAPLSAFPLLPVAAVLWGPFVAAVVSIIAWTIGSVIAYVLAQKVGRGIAKKFVSLEKADKIAGMVAGRNPFWTVLILRMIIPVDVLSYALGLLVPMKLSTYTLATLIGVTPFAFVFSYITDYSLVSQVIIVAAILAFVALVYTRLARQRHAG